VDAATPIKPGAGVAVTAGLEVGGVGFWSLLPLQVIYAEETAQGRGGRRFRHGCGCLGSHWFQGEERFR